MYSSICDKAARLTPDATASSSSERPRALRFSRSCVPTRLARSAAPTSSPGGSGALRKLAAGARLLLVWTGVFSFFMSPSFRAPYHQPAAATGRTRGMAPRRPPTGVNVGAGECSPARETIKKIGGRRRNSDIAQSPQVGCCYFWTSSRVPLTLVEIRSTKCGLVLYRLYDVRRHFIPGLRCQHAFHRDIPLGVRAASSSFGRHHLFRR